MKNISIFASGNGSNALRLLEKFEDHPEISVKSIVCNNINAGVIQHAKSFNKKLIMIDRSQLNDSNKLTQQLQHDNIDLIVLAGFLWLIPQCLIKAFPNKIINLHPSLLPKYGGKGMYGSKVHNAVLQNGEIKSGITIHYVNEKFDEGEIIKQFTCDVNSDDTVNSLAGKIHKLEHAHLPQVVEHLLN